MRESSVAEEQPLSRSSSDSNSNLKLHHYSSSRVLAEAAAVSKTVKRSEVLTSISL